MKYLAMLVVVMACGCGVTIRDAHDYVVKNRCKVVQVIPPFDYFSAATGTLAHSNGFIDYDCQNQAAIIRIEEP